MTRTGIVATILATCTAVVMSAALGLAAQPPSGMAAKDQAMMVEHEKMMSSMKAADQRLEDLVVKMKTASATDKMAATADVVAEMVTQRRTMRDGMMKMQDGMMSHMMEHLQAGTASMASCPMLKPMSGMKH